MSAGLRARRIEQEWLLLERLILRNPHCLASARHKQEALVDVFAIKLLNTIGLITEGIIAEEHDVSLRFPRFYPTQPIEAYLAQPVFHPNVDPRNGFVCLWTRVDPGDTAMEALRRLQVAITWQAWNEDVDHVMQPAALDWLHHDADRKSLPLACQPLVELESFRRQKDHESRREPRRRLTPLDGE